MRREKTNYVIQSVSHALDVLEQFADPNTGELGVTELSKRLKLHKNNVFRLLATLESRGYIEQNRASENYRLGIRCLQLGQAYVGNMGVVTQARRLTEMRSEFYAQDRAMAWLMGGVCVALLLVTAMGIVGLASFWVQQRTRMIGTRRALGATEGQIRRYFQLENLLLTTTGVVIGTAGAVALSQLLMQSYEVPRLPWFYLPAGAASLWLLGQVAVWVPARRAARLSPVAALRS